MKYLIVSLLLLTGCGRDCDRVITSATTKEVWTCDSAWRSHGVIQGYLCSTGSGHYAESVSVPEGTINRICH